MYSFRITEEEYRVLKGTINLPQTEIRKRIEYKYAIKEKDKMSGESCYHWEFIAEQSGKGDIRRCFKLPDNVRYIGKSNDFLCCHYYCHITAIIFYSNFRNKML